MADHGLCLRRLSAPNPVNTISAPPSNNHGPSPPAGRGVGGPVEASAAPAAGDTDGASACIGGDAAVIAVVSADGVALATPTAGGVGLRLGGAAVGARGGHTWLNETVVGCTPLPTE
jgi:hypothetical protein